MKQRIIHVVTGMLAVVMLMSACVAGMAEEAEPVAMSVDGVPAITGAEAELEQIVEAPVPEETADAGEAAAAPVAGVDAPMSVTAPEESAPMSAGNVQPMGVAVVNKQTITMNVGDVMQLEAALEAPVTWKSKKARIASVDDSGTVTANAEGTTSVTAKSGKQTVKVTVKVVDPYKPSAVALDVGSEIQLTLQDTLALTPVLSPETARATYTWKSSKPAVVAVDNGVLYPQKEGVSTITVKTQNKKSAKVKVHVVDPFKPAGVALDVTGTVTLKPGESFTLTPSLTPDTAQATYTWKSSKPGAASVDQGGVVTALAKGTAKISVTTQNKKKATVTVKVVSDQPASSSGALPMRMTAKRYKYFRKYMNQSEFDAALAVVRPTLEQMLNWPVEDQVYGVWEIAGSFGFDYSMSTKHYNDPYGVLVNGVASCAGTTRTVGFMLNLLGLEYEHVHENKYDHQWARVNVNGAWWICDGFGGIGYCGPEGDPNQPIVVRDGNGNVVYTTYAYMNDDAYNAMAGSN